MDKHFTEKELQMALTNKIMLNSGYEKYDFKIFSLLHWQRSWCLLIPWGINKALGKWTGSYIVGRGTK